MDFTLPKQTDPCVTTLMSAFLNAKTTPSFMSASTPPSRLLAKSAWPSMNMPLEFSRDSGTKYAYNLGLCRIICLLISFVHYGQLHDHACRAEFAALIAPLLSLYRHPYLRKPLAIVLSEFKVVPERPLAAHPAHTYVPSHFAHTIWENVSPYSTKYLCRADVYRNPRPAPAEFFGPWLTPNQDSLRVDMYDEAFLAVFTLQGHMILHLKNGRFTECVTGHTCECMSVQSETFASEITRIYELYGNCPHLSDYLVPQEYDYAQASFPPMIYASDFISKGHLQSVLESFQHNSFAPRFKTIVDEDDSFDDDSSQDSEVEDEPAFHQNAPEEPIFHENAVGPLWTKFLFAMTLLFLTYSAVTSTSSEKLVYRAMSQKPYRATKLTDADRAQIKTVYPEQDMDSIIQEIRSLKSEIKQGTKQNKKQNAPARKTLRQFSQKLSPALVSRADDFPVFQSTGQSDYLKCVLAPDSGPAQIPDDVVQQCHVKAETVTYNLDVVESGSGVILLLPEHPTDLIGYHYTQNALGQMVFDKTLRTAQNLPDNYDYARRVSQLVTIKSSTIPSGVYALNGTFNAVRVEGTFSEIPSLSLSGDDFYNGILTNTVDILDKVGNVLVGDGLAVLSLMGTIDQPFTRLGDTTPVTLDGVSLQENAILDLSESLLYHTVASGPWASNASSTVKNAGIIMNLDSTTGVVVDVGVTVNIPAGSAFGIIVGFNFLDPFGNAIVPPFSPVQEQVVAVTPNEQVFASFHLSFHNYEGPPIAAISVEITASVATFSAVGTALYTIDCTVPAAARLGLNRPVVVVAYQGVAGGSVLTVGGVTNFELIPNPVLRQNLQLSNGYADEQELEYAKNLLHARHSLGLKSVWRLPDYWAMRPALEELSDLTKNEHAVAFGKADLLKFMKNKFLPALVKPVTQVLSGALPEFAPAFNALAAPFVSRAASGKPVLYRAMNKRPTHAKPKKGAIVGPTWRVVMFPTIITPENSLVMKGAELFAVSTVKPQKMEFPVFTKTVDGYKIYGITEDKPYPFPTGMDLWVFAINPIAAAKRQIIIIHGEPVTGSSAQTAIYLAAHGSHNGLFYPPVTGELDKNLNVQRCPAFDEKSRWLAARGVTLAGNDISANPKITNLLTNNLVSDRKSSGRR